MRCKAQGNANLETQVKTGKSTWDWGYSFFQDCKVVLEVIKNSLLISVWWKFCRRALTWIINSWDRARFSVVDFILGARFCRRASSCVAALACTLARPSSLLFPLVEIQRNLTWFPFLCNLLINLYIRQTNSWPDCCRGFLSVRAAVLLLLSNLIV